MLRFVETDRTVTLAEQLQDEGGRVVLINTLVISPEDVDRFLDAWSADATILQRQPGFISAQLHRGIAGSGAFLNYAVWETVAQYKAAFETPELTARRTEWPDGVTASPHLFRPIAVPGISRA